MKLLLSCLRNLLRKRRAESDLEAELQFHLEMETEQNAQRGRGPREARRQAVLALGGVDQVKERCRDARAGAFLDILLKDLQYAVRSLLRSPGLLAVILLTLALGIGAATAIFSVAHAVLLRPLAYPEPDRLSMLWLREKDNTVSNTS
jgi:hypothetical protein